VELKEDVADADMPYNGLTIRSFPDSLEYCGGFSFRPRLDRLEKLIKDILRILKLVQFSLELAMFAIQSPKEELYKNEFLACCPFLKKLSSPRIKLSSPRILAQELHQR
jgi:hypothetical protein